MKFKEVRAKRQYYLTVESRFMDTHPLYTDTLLLQTVFFTSREGTYKFSSTRLRWTSVNEDNGHLFLAQ